MSRFRIGRRRLGRSRNITIHPSRKWKFVWNFFKIYNLQVVSRNKVRRTSTLWINFFVEKQDTFICFEQRKILVEILQISKYNYLNFSVLNPSFKNVQDFRLFFRKLSFSILVTLNACNYKKIIHFKAPFDKKSSHKNMILL